MTRLDRLFVRDDSRVGEVAERLDRALDEAGYSERSYFAAPDGFVLVTRMEQLSSVDASPVPGRARWSDEPYRPDFSLGWYLQTLLQGRVGFFRVVVFVITDRPVVATPDAPDRETATAWLGAGADRLTARIAALPWSQEHAVTALIYEFAVDAGASPETLRPGRFSAARHISTTGIEETAGGQ